MNLESVLGTPGVLKKRNMRSDDDHVGALLASKKRIYGIRDAKAASPAVYYVAKLGFRREGGVCGDLFAVSEKRYVLQHPAYTRIDQISLTGS
jgi:hypothetical protein